MKAEQLLKAISKEYGYSVKEIKGKKRVYPLPECRQMFCLIALDHLPKNRIYDTLKIHHSTFIHNIKVIEVSLEVYARVRNHHQNILKSLGYENQNEPSEA